jgi:hypothetical protein
MAGIPMKRRLGAYNLEDRAGTLVDLTLAANEEKVLSKDTPEFSASVVELKPDSLNDLRRWIGPVATVPPQVEAATKQSKQSAARAPSASTALEQVAQISSIGSIASSVPVPFDPAFRADMFTLTRKIALDYAPTNSVIEASINQWLTTLNASIWAYLFNDIYVSAGASLIFQPDVSLLFAHYVTVEETGQIILQSGTFKFDIAGFKGLVPPAGGTGTTGTTGTGTSA